MARVSRVSMFLCGLLVATGSAATQDLPEPLDLLDRMSEAVRQLDYEGRFVVQSLERLDAMYIVHRVDQGVEKERVVSLTGEPREIIRSDEAVLCRLPGQSGQISVGVRSNRHSFSPLSGVSGDQLNASYDIRMLEPGRVAGRDSYQLLIQPRDELRYGYRLFIDRDSALPLWSIMFDDLRAEVAQLMFVELRVGRAITPIEHDLSAMQLAKADPSEPPVIERTSSPAWVFAELPPGFRLDVHRRQALRQAAGERDHFIFSDGLATVSVYVQPSGEHSGLKGVSRLGSARAVGRMVGDHEVIAVGEVPVKTLRWFVDQIRAAGS